VAEARQKRNPVEVVFEDPAEREARPGMYDSAIEAVKEKPGVWARVRILHGSAGAYAARKKLVDQLANDPAWQVKVGRTYSSENEQERAVFLRYRTEEQMNGSGGN
jgi:hypothetical protein